MKVVFHLFVVIELSIIQLDKALSEKFGVFVILLLIRTKWNITRRKDMIDISF